MGRKKNYIKIPVKPLLSAITAENKTVESVLRNINVNEDYVTDLKGKHDLEGLSIMTARNLISIGARSCGVLPIDTVHIRVHDLEDLEKNLKLSKNLGFEGMMVLNPKELPLVHQYYSPTAEEISWAKEMILLAEEAAEEGRGVAVKDNKFIGPPMVKMARAILKKQEMIDVKKEKYNYG